MNRNNGLTVWVSGDNLETALRVFKGKIRRSGIFGALKMRKLAIESSTFEPWDESLKN